VSAPQHILTHLLDDPYLVPFREHLARRQACIAGWRKRLTGVGPMSLREFASGHLYFGLHRTEAGWVAREWLPNAVGVVLVGDFCGWDESKGGAFPGAMRMASGSVSFPVTC